MRTNAFPLRFVLCALCALALWSAPAFSQRLDRGLEVDTIHSDAKERPNVPVEHTMSDWTHDHMLYPRFGPMNRLIALQKDPRAIQHWQESYRKDYVRWRRGGEGHRSEHHNRSTMHPDWSISLGSAAFIGPSGGIYAGVYPAKWTFDSNETVTGPFDAGACAKDYLAVTIDAANTPNPNNVSGFGPGVGQPNIIGLNNLYSGDASGAHGAGVCDRTPNGTIDNGISATQYFSYTVLGDDGIAQTSPVTSMDGNLIAFVEGTGFATGASHFHVLAWKAGDGNNNGTSRQDVLTNALQITSFVAGPPVAGLTGTATDLPLISTDTYSSPYVEYSDDVAYVGDDAGEIYKIKHVFCPAWAPCTGDPLDPTGQPYLDPTWGTSGVLKIATVSGIGTCTSTSSVSSITVDGASGNIFAGCADGRVYAFTPSGAFVGSLAVGDGGGNGGIIDAPVLDSVNGWVYVETGSCITGLTNCTTTGVAGGGDPVLVQASTDLTTTVNVATLGPGGNTFNIHAPAFNDAYFTNGLSTNWLLYEYSSDNVGPPGTSPEIVLYGIGFGAGHAMTPGAPANANHITALGAATEVSPLTEFLTTGGEDRLFGGALIDAPGNIVSWEIGLPPTTPSIFPTSSTPEGFAQEGSGTSGIVVDNTSSSGQANSIYFGTWNGGTVNPSSVVKLNQTAVGGGLN